MKEFFTSMPRVLLRIYSGKNILWQLLAVLLTFISVTSGFDWYYFTSVRNSTLNTLSRPALLGGFLLPILLPLILIVWSTLHKKESPKNSRLGWTLTQAAFLGWAISSFYKVFTGRVQPDLIHRTIDSSRNFEFGFLRHGIFWGWPSSHTAVAFALAFAYITTLPSHMRTQKVLAFLCALYVGISVSFAIHWFSEFVAGAIIGSIIGIAVGKEWRGKSYK